MSSKHFLTDPTHLVNSSLHSLTLTNPLLALNAQHKVIFQRSPPQNNVSLLSGGGSGHEPSFSSLVGPGLLTASIAGTIFASPSSTQVSASLKHVPTQNGVLVVVMNYTGDILNFGMAVEKARAKGVRAEMVVVRDDVGVGRGAGGKVGRRGIAGTCLVVKITGALKETGASLEECVKVANLTAENVASIGASLSHVHVPGRSVTEGGEDGLAADEIEIGMGIHNEAGSERVKTDLEGLVGTMLKRILDTSDEDRGFIEISKEDEVVLLVNNLGAVSVLEMGGIVAELMKQLDESYGIKPVRILAGTYMTSLNGHGFSISLLRVQDTGLGKGKSMLELLDAPSEAAGWSAPIKTETWNNRSTETKSEDIDETTQIQAGNLKLDPALTRTALTTALQRLIAAEPDVTNYDTIVGDGDCGIGLARGAEALLKAIEKSKQETLSDAVLLLQTIIQAVEATMDGTSGALYAIFLNSLAAAIASQSAELSSPKQAEPLDWGKALWEAERALGKYTPARPGDRTLMDALAPFVEELANTADVRKAAEKAQQGAAETKGMKASLGRTVYVGGEGWQGVPDPGAYGLAEFLSGLAEGLHK